MPKFKLGQAVKVVHGSAEPFRGRIAKIEPMPLQFYRVEATGKDGRAYAMTVEEGWLEPEEPDMAWRKTDVPTLDTGAFAQSLKSLAFSNVTLPSPVAAYCLAADRNSSKDTASRLAARPRREATSCLAAAPAFSRKF